MALAAGTVSVKLDEYYGYFSWRENIFLAEFPGYMEWIKKNACLIKEGFAFFAIQDFQLLYS